MSSGQLLDEQSSDWVVFACRGSTPQHRQKLLLLLPEESASAMTGGENRVYTWLPNTCRQREARGHGGAKE